MFKMTTSTAVFNKTLWWEWSQASYIYTDLSSSSRCFALDSLLALLPFHPSIRGGAGAYPGYLRAKAGLRPGKLCVASDKHSFYYVCSGSRCWQTPGSSELWRMWRSLQNNRTKRWWTRRTHCTAMSSPRTRVLITAGYLKAHPRHLALSVHHASVR